MNGIRRSLAVLTLLIANVMISRAQSGLPIRAARTISFTTDEGSYMDVDVAPDGKTLLFTILGDIYMLPATGGKARQLTRGLAVNFRPVWSPDGKKFAYMSDASGDMRIQVTDTGRKTTCVAGQPGEEIGYYDDGYGYGPEPIWTPDGHYIAYGTNLYGVAGGKLAFDSAAGTPVGIAPDGRHIYSIGYDSSYKFRHVYIYNQVDRSKVALPAKVEWYDQGKLSPDGRWWCYVAGNGKKTVVAQDVSTGQERILVPILRANDTDAYKAVSSHFSISSDSRYLWIGYGGKIHRISIESGEDVVIPFVADVKADLGAFDYHTYPVTYDPINVKLIRSANASPDGRHLVFSTLNKIYVMDLPGGKPRVLCAQAVNQFEPAYSPDGRWIAYVSWADMEGGYLWRVPAGGGEPQQLTRVAGRYEHPTWTPDSKNIAVLRGNPLLAERDFNGNEGKASARLELVTADGGEVRVLDDTVAFKSCLSISADGQTIYYGPGWGHDDQGMAPLLVSRDLRGKNQQVVAIGDNRCFSGSLYSSPRSMSPDGRYIVYSLREDLYLAPVDKAQFPTQIIDLDGHRELPVVRFAAGIDPCWEKGGKVLAWCYGNHFYRIDPDKVMAAAEKRKLVPANDRGRFFQTVAIVPDQRVTVDIAVPSNYGQGTIALKNVRIITMKGDKVIERGTIVIRNGRIAGLGPVGALPVPEGAKVIDLSGATIMPGMFDLHDHLHLGENIIAQQDWHLLVNLAYGVTGARDPALDYDSYNYAEMLRAGQMIGPRLYTVGRAVRGADGYLRIDDTLDANAVVHKRKELGGIVVKNYLPPWPRDKRQWVLLACEREGLNMTNEGYNSELVNLAEVKDGSTGFEHNPHWGDPYKDVIKFFAQSGTWFTPTFQVANGATGGGSMEYFEFKYWHQPDEKLSRFYVQDKMLMEGTVGNSLDRIMAAKASDTVHPLFLPTAKTDARFVRAGGKVTIGSHGNDAGIGVHNELWAIQMGGLTNMEALRVATILGAEGCGVQKDLGSLEVGKIADLIVLNKNPLEDIHNSREIRFVMKDGVLYNGDTLDEIWPVVKKCPEWKLK